MSENYLYISSLMKIGLPLTWPMVYTTACTAVEAVIKNATFLFAEVLYCVWYL